MLNLIFIVVIFFSVKAILSNGLILTNILFWALPIILMGVFGYINSIKRKDIIKRQRFSYVFRNISFGLISTYGFGLTQMGFDSHNIFSFFNMNLFVGILMLLLALTFSFS